MRKHAVATLLVSVGWLLASGNIGAIKHGQLDGNNHPFVGLMVAQDANGTPLWRCSGTLLSERIFLTAGHCTEAPAAHIEIWFAADVENGIPANGYPFDGDVGGTPFTHPLYNPNAFFLHDLGVVQLDADFPMTDYGALPALDVLESMSKANGHSNSTFTSVGYGIQKSFPDAASWKDVALRIRMVANPRLVQINTPLTGDFSILLSNNANTGGICFGDSGGPNFIGSSNVIAGVTSYVRNSICAGSGGVYRIDRSDDLDWLETEFGITP